MRIFVSTLARILPAAILITAIWAESPAAPQASPPAVFHVSKRQRTFLVLSDIHFDPFADRDAFSKLRSAKVEEWESILRSSPTQTFSQYGNDSNYPLLAASLEAARKYGSKQHFDYVVVSGDYLAHNFQAKYQAAGGQQNEFPEFVIKTMIFVSRTVQQAFPSLPVYGSLGNNDSVCGDYRLTPGGPFLAAVAREWKAVAANSLASRDFADGGYYALPHPTVPRHELIVLDTTFWSANYEDACSKTPGEPGTAELNWLRRKLQQLRREKKTASLIMHIPPGIDGYNSARAGSCGQVTSLWKPSYSSDFLQIIEANKGLLRDGYAGHMHMDDFRVVTDKTGKPFFQMHMVPAISPVYNNNPSFEIALYNKSNGNLLDYAMVYLTNLADFNQSNQKQPVWSVEYAVDSGYQIQAYGPEGAEKIIQAIRTDEKTRAQYIHFYAVESPKPPSVNEKNWLSYSCAQSEIMPDAFEKCSCRTSSSFKMESSH